MAAAYERLANGQIWRYYERTTGETLHVRAPFYLCNDFNQFENTVTTAPMVNGSTVINTPFSQYGSGTLTNSAAAWEQVEDAQGSFKITSPDTTSAATLVGLNSESGTTGSLFVGNTTTSKYFQVEFRLKLSAIIAQTGYNFGMIAGTPFTAGQGPGTAPLVHAAFTVAGLATAAGVPSTGTTLNIYTSCADGVSTAVGCTDSGVDATADTYMNCRIDFTDKSNLKFYVNGTQINPSTTHTFSAVVSGKLTPFLNITRTASVAAATQQVLTIDKFQAWGIR